MDTSMDCKADTAHKEHYITLYSTNVNRHLIKIRPRDLTLNVHAWLSSEFQALPPVCRFHPDYSLRERFWRTCVRQRQNSDWPINHR